MRVLVSNEALLGIALVELGLVVIPGPNMIYLVSRSSRKAGGQG
jgi:threonine/homoserine/homoserine lactone efflux protein